MVNKSPYRENLNLNRATTRTNDTDVHTKTHTHERERCESRLCSSNSGLSVTLVHVRVITRNRPLINPGLFTAISP